MTAKAKPEQDEALQFPTVLEKEIEDLKKRRREVCGDSAWQQPDLSRLPPRPTEEQKLRRQTLDNDLVGLALSGGGIRSATFCLGFIQGLAALGLLPRIDYLSTVSGGGYIGGWLAAWIKREEKVGPVSSVANVARQLCPNRIDQAQAQRWGETQGQVLDDEAEPIRHLRAYSNYLAPRPGVFSADGWVLIAIYLRNLLLNQLVLLHALLGVLFLVVLVVKLFAAVAYVPDVPAWHGMAAVQVVTTSAGAGSPGFSSLSTLGPTAGALELAGEEAFETHTLRPIDWGTDWLFWLLLVAGFFGPLLMACINTYRGLCQVENPPGQQSEHGASIRTVRRRLHTLLLIPLLAAAVSASLLSIYLLGPLTAHLQWKPALGFAAGFALFHTLFQVRPYGRSFSGHWLDYPRWLLSGVLAGALGGLLFYVLLIRLHALTDASYAYVPAIATLGPPLLLAIFVLTGFVQIGVLGRLLGEAQREWWSSLGGWVLMYAAAWLLVFGTVIFGPWLVLWRPEGDGWSRWANQAALLVAWVASVLGGLSAARSPRTDGEPPSSYPAWIMDLMARLAPPAFLAGLLVLVALFANCLVNQEIPSNSQDYLIRLNDANGSVSVQRLAACLASLLGEPGQHVEGPWYRSLLAACVQPWCLTLASLAAVSVALLVMAHWLGGWVDVNVFSLQGLYSNRLIRCYLGASRRKPVAPAHGRVSDRPPGATMNTNGPPRNPNAITGFDPLDDIKLNTLQVDKVGPPDPARPVPPPEDRERPYWGPLLIINTALNLVHGEELAWQERKAESFALTPHYCGSQTTGYRPTEQYAGGLGLGAAMGTSGAAVSPNMGYHSSTGVSALLTLFNGRLGAWLGNPRRQCWGDPGPSSGLMYLLHEMFSRTDDQDRYIYLSDGGHFDNLGVYELIRRRCRFIVVCDAGADPDFTLEDLGSLIRKVRIDFGVRIDIDLSSLRPRPRSLAGSHVAVGKIRYGDVDRPPNAPYNDADLNYHPEADEGLLVYVKPTLTGDEPPDLDNYAAQHPSFPHQATLNQFFTESQFESYRTLGYHSAEKTFEEVLSDWGTEPAPCNRELFSALYDHWVPPPPDFTRSYLEASQEYVAVQKELGTNALLRRLSAELYPEAPENRYRGQEVVGPPGQEMFHAERHMVAQMLSVLENAWFGLHLDRYRRHPIHTGWMTIFQRWLAAPTVQANWRFLRGEFSHVFQEFVDRQLAQGPSRPTPPSNG